MTVSSSLFGLIAGGEWDSMRGAVWNACCVVVIGLSVVVVCALDVYELRSKRMEWDGWMDWSEQTVGRSMCSGSMKQEIDN